MGAFDGDGRLELDELGAVIDDATTLRPADTLEDPVGSPTLGERLEAAGVLPWVRRHRVLVSGVAAVAAIAVGAAVLQASNAPPPLDLEIVGDVLDATGALRGGGAPGEVLTATYTVTGTRAGETVEVIGISGPGLRTSRAQPAAFPVGGDDPDTDVSAVIDCTEASALTARDDQYSVWIRRTDRWDRAVTEPRPLPGTGASWAGTIRMICWPDTSSRLLSVDDVQARPDLLRGSVTLLLTLSSRMPVAVRIGTEAIYGDAVAIGRTFAPVLDPGGSAEIDVLLDINSCDAVSVPAWWSGSAAGYTALAPGLLYSIASLDGADVASTALPFTEEQTATVQRALDRVCDGAPRVTPSVVSAGPAVQARDVALLVPVSLRLDVEGGSLVTASLPRDDLTSEPAVLEPDARGLVDGTWLVYCNYPQPMRVEALVEVDGRRYPWAWQSTDERLAAQIVAACPSMSREVLTTYGWPPSG